MKGECPVEAYRVGILFLLLSLSAAGLDVTAKYLCRFTVLSSSAVPIDSSPVSPLSSSNITCSTPAFPVGPPSLSFNRTSSLWLVSGGKPIAAIPFYGASSINTVDPCTDKEKNGDETDVDCGGSVCPTCALGKACKATADCSSSNVCSTSTNKCINREFPLNVLDVCFFHIFLELGN